MDGSWVISSNLGQQAGHVAFNVGAAGAVKMVVEALVANMCHLTTAAFPLIFVLLMANRVRETYGLEV